MKKSPDIRCPTCGRPIKAAFDFPRIRVLAVERLPLPEAIDSMSAEAAEKRLRRRQSTGEDRGFDDGINRTPEIQRACEQPALLSYFETLNGLVGREVVPDALRPPWTAGPTFRHAYRIADTELWLAVHEQEPADSGRRVAAVDILCRGPSLGSAGGPTLMVLGPVVRVEYVGVLDHPAKVG